MPKNNSNSPWVIKTHTIPAAYPREFARSTRNPSAQLKVVINQYIPVNHTPSAGDITLIVTHANGFHKELYEPFLEELLVKSTDAGFRIRSIWAIDAAHQGASGAINEKELGDDPCWNDYCRDIEHMINTFAADMPHPIIGIGHSMGGQVIFECALRNPGLFIGVVGIDPVIQTEVGTVFAANSHPASASVRRRDVWPSREDAEEFFRSRAFYKAWDPRALDLHIKYGLRPLPTHLHPVPPNPTNGVTLTTTKHQEVLTFLRPKPSHPDGLYRPEPSRTFHNLQHITIPILYIFARKSDVSNPEAVKLKMEKNKHNAEMMMIENAGHFVLLEKPGELADAVAPWLARCSRRWEKERERKEDVEQLISKDFLRRLAKL